MKIKRGKGRCATLVLGILFFAYFCLAVRAAGTDERTSTVTDVTDATERELATEGSSPVASSDRTSNAILEAEQNTLEAVHIKYADGSTKKSRAQEQLKPYPYVNRNGSTEQQRKVHQSKRSEQQPDQVTFNANFSVSVYENQLIGAISTTELTSTTDAYPVTENTSPNNESTTTGAAVEQQATETATTTEIESSTESMTESPTSTPVPSSTETSTISSTSTDSEVSVTTEPTTTLREDTTTLSLSDEHPTTETNTIITSGRTDGDRGKTTKTPETMSTTAVETTTMTTTTIVIEATAVLPSSESPTPQASTTSSVANTIGLRQTPVTTVTSEAFSSVTTWQDEESTATEVVTPTPSPAEKVTLFISIVFKETWNDVCAKLPDLRQSLVDLVNNSEDKTTISTAQIIFQTKCSDNLNTKSLGSDGPLICVLAYVTNENGSFDENLTRLLPKLYQKTPINFPLTINSFTLVQKSANPGNAIAVVVVSCVAFICLILLAGLLFIMRKRQGRFNYGERCRPVSLDAYSLDSVSAYNSVRRSKVLLRSSKRSYGNPAFEDSSLVPTHPLDLSGLASFSEDAAALSEEFASIPQISAKIDELPAGADVKNRYANVIPLPETRVPLQKLNGDPVSEYINASYVRGPKNASRYYIACQAPTEDTVADFWRMLWEQQCRVIIMLTDLVENGTEKCAEYIPPLEVSDCHRLYGDFQVTLKKREAKEKYAISTLHLKNLENNTFREVSHIWYLWPANGVPMDAASLIAVLLEARALQRGAAGPILVHCSPGTGRTGTVIALDLCIRQYEVTRTVDVPRVVYTIRRDRAGAVQTREQYAFIYKGLKLYAGKLANGATES